MSGALTKIARKLFGIAHLEVYREGGAVPIDFHNYRYMSYENITRFLYFKNLYDRIAHLEGDVVECGIAGGKTFSYLASLAKYEGMGRKLWGFDSFSGLPAPTKDDGESVGWRGKFSVEIGPVIGYLQAAGINDEFLKTQVRFVPGFFEESLDKYQGPGIALLHADVDLYESYMHIFEKLYDKIVPGGIIAFDEYLRPTELSQYPGAHKAGAHKAINEFLGDKKQYIESDRVTGKFFYVKPNEK